jgi:hypothetical protein
MPGARSVDALPASRPTRIGSGASRWALAAVLLFSVVTRVGWVLYVRDAAPGATRSPDTPSYVQPARSLVEHGTFTASDGEPLFVRTPGYPLAIAAVFSVDNSDTAFLVVQALLSCLIVLLAYLIAARLWGPWFGVVAATIMALEPLQFAASGTLLTESLFSLLLLCVVAIGFRVFKEPSAPLPWLVALGGSVAAVTMVRPTTYYLPIVVVAFVAVASWRFGVRTVVTMLVAFLLPIIVVVGGWQLRNREETGSWRFSGIEGFNAYYYYGAAVLAAADGTSVDRARDTLNKRLRADERAICPRGGRCRPAEPTRPGPFYDLLYDRGVSTVTSHPTEAVTEVVKSLGRELFGPGTDTVSRYLDVESSRFLSMVLAAWLAGFYAAVAYGLFVVFRHPDSRVVGHLFALAVAAYVVVVSAGPGIGYARYRGPVMPILSLYAALGLVSAFVALHSRVSTRRSTRELGLQGR